jgi:hypothetical protein
MFNLIQHTKRQGSLWWRNQKKKNKKTYKNAKKKKQQIMDKNV